MYGLSVRMTFAGQDKHGVVVRLDTGEEFQIVVQDDLTGLETFSCMAEGHFVQNGAE